LGQGKKGCFAVGEPINYPSSREEEEERRQTPRSSSWARGEKKKKENEWPTAYLKPTLGRKKGELTEDPYSALKEAVYLREKKRSSDA